jgi:Protein of unknown function (DUF664)
MVVRHVPWSSTSWAELIHEHGQALIEETARHAGHADILREQIDR